MVRVADLIVADGIALRRARPNDAVLLFALFNSWAVIRWLARPPWPVPLESVEGYLESVNQDPHGEHYWVIERGGVLLGGISANIAPASATQSAEGPHIGYWLGEPYWGQGVVTIAARELVRAIFSAMPVPAIYSGVFEGNGASLRIQHKLGFVVEARNTLFCKPRNMDLPHLSTVLTRQMFEKIDR
ncbi:RimL Acetyltransferases, including N-acetylases of ribosomal proteins [Rhabdaerophilaceae bacterium]